MKRERASGEKHARTYVGNVAAAAAATARNTFVACGGENGFCFGFLFVLNGGECSPV